MWAYIGGTGKLLKALESCVGTEASGDEDGLTAGIWKEIDVYLFKSN